LGLCQCVIPGKILFHTSAPNEEEDIILVSKAIVLIPSKKGQGLAGPSRSFTSKDILEFGNVFCNSTQSSLIMQQF
jgi:hypothetical protein